MSVLLCSQCPDALASGRQMEWCYPPVHWGRGRVGQPCAAESGGLPMRGRLIDTIRYADSGCGEMAGSAVWSAYGSRAALRARKANRSQP